MRIFSLLILLVVASALQSQVVVNENVKHSKYTFPLVASKIKATVCYDANDYPVVKKVAELFVSDIENVTGQRLKLADEWKKGRTVVIVGTIEKNQAIRQLASNGKIDISPLEGAWERYLIQTVNHPFPGVDKALIVAGSDRRGASYGLFSLSEMAGVSPWYWWADVPVKKHKTLYVDAPTTVSKTPSVKYRGVFLNDEDWGLKPWAAKTFEKERGNIGPRTYAKICELLLRLKANHLAPAMHPVSTAFYKIPENKLVADTFAIVMGSSHCEPLLLNTASEWNSKTMGPWDYGKNKDKINEVLGNRVKENCAYENVYTLALRGLHDAVLGVSFGFLLLLYRQLVRIKVYSDKLCRVCCVLRGRKIYIKGFVDTGNVLQDPLFHRPVCIAQKDSFLEVLHEINDCTKVKYHVIPFRSLGCDSGMLEVITADTMYICYGKKEIQVEDALIGLTAQTLSSDGEYEFLVNAQLLKG